MLTLSIYMNLLFFEKIKGGQISRSIKNNRSEKNPYQKKIDLKKKVVVKSITKGSKWVTDRVKQRKQKEGTFALIP